MNRKDALLWLLHRITAVALIVLLIIHFWVLHYMNPASSPNMADLIYRLRTVSFIVTDYGLLIIALFHGLNGIRNIVIDYTSKESVIRGWSIGLTVLGAIAFAFGGYALLLVTLR